MKFKFDKANRFQRRCLKLLTTTTTTTTEHGYTISSPCEPDGSGELKTASYDNLLLAHEKNSCATTQDSQHTFLSLRIKYDISISPFLVYL